MNKSKSDFSKVISIILCSVIIVLQIIFLVLRGAKVILWDWPIVLLPILIPIGGLAILFLLTIFAVVTVANSSDDELPPKGPRNTNQF